MAGSFYPAETHKLKKLLSSLLLPFVPGRSVKAVILPHAGYIYSGRTVGKVIRQVNIPPTCFLIGPNHQGRGEPFAVYPEGRWATPLGQTPIDEEFASGLLEASHDLAPDLNAHQMEHALEVEVPFLQFRNREVRIVPLVIGTLNLLRVREAALSMTEYLKTRSSYLLVISTDMSHYDNDQATREKDRYALSAIEALDEEKLAEAVKRYGITMCGFAPVYLALILAKALGAQKATLVDYRTSADASGDYDRVVGYAGFIID